MNISELRFSRSARKALVSMDAKLRQRILAALNGLLQFPPIGDIKPLAGMEGKYRLRVGSYRIIYRYDPDGTLTIVFIEDIDSRGDIYK